MTFINSRAGTQRQVGGGFEEGAGRVAAFKELVSRFVQGDASEKAAVLKEASGLQGLGDMAKHYVTAFTRIVEGKVDYAKTEVARLTKMMSGGGALKPTQKASFMKRINILREFL